MNNGLPLPHRVASQVLAGIPDLASQVGGLAVPLWSVREELRKHLIDAGTIIDVPEENAGTEVAAVDGGTVTQAFYLGDLLVSMAFAAPGQNSTIDVDDEAFARSWFKFQAHQTDQDRLSKVAMMGGEVAVAAALPHDVVMLDGSFQTPVLAFTSVLSSQNPTVRALAVEVLNSWDIDEALAKVCSPTDGAAVVACPKSDSETSLIDWMRTDESLGLPQRIIDSLTPLPDKVAAAMLLEPGEMTAPRPTPRRWSELKVRAAKDDAAATDLAKRLDAGVEPLRARPADTDKGVSVVYALPPDGVSAIKVEVKRALGIEHAGKVVASLFTECFQPHILEPFPQVIADEWAKSVSEVARALHGGALNQLTHSPDIDPAWLQLAALTHRTSR